MPNSEMKQEASTEISNENATDRNLVAQDFEQKKLEKNILESAQKGIEQAQIKRLTQKVINRISAGEVLERPAAAVKELVENALDANASRIRITLRHGGKSLIRVQDNGDGMSKDNLMLATERHATSKLKGDDLSNIYTFGFRGEALAAIAAVSRMTIKTKQENLGPIEIFVEGGRMGECNTSEQQTKGTVVEVQDLFFATPARLRFLRGDNYESTLIMAQIERIAMANPFVEFECFEEKRKKLSLPAIHENIDFRATQKRVEQILGVQFIENAFPISTQHQRMRIRALCALPTYNTNSSAKQFLFVNNRPIQDKSLSGTIRVAYGDAIPARRFPVFTIFIEIPHREVDVNVHPSKTEVRFRDTQALRLFILSAIKRGLDSNARRAANAAYRLASLNPTEQNKSEQNIIGNVQKESAQDNDNYSIRQQRGFTKPPEILRERIQTKLHGEQTSSSAAPYSKYRDSPSTQDPSTLPTRQESPTQPAQEQNYSSVSKVPNSSVQNSSWATGYPLGAAKACLHKNYIVAQNAEGLILVDSHAAHERLLYEKLKRDYDAKNIPIQKLLIPEIVQLAVSEIQILQEQGESVKNFGFLLEIFDEKNASLLEIPALLKTSSAVEMVGDLCSLLRAEQPNISEEKTKSQTLVSPPISATSLLSQSLVDKILSRLACHAAVRSSQNLSIDEMNTLLRNLEKESKSAQCNHGRPTYISLTLKDLEKLFERD